MTAYLKKSLTTPAKKSSKVQNPRNILFPATVKGKKPLTQEEGENLIINYIIEEMRPLSCVEKRSFKDLVIGFAQADIHIPCRRTLAKRLDERRRIIADNMTQCFEKVSYICTTADIWSCHNRSFLGMTAHFIEPDTFERKNFILGCKRFKYSHTYDKIAQAISTVHSEFNLPVDKITHTVTDNASNFGKAFRQFHKKTVAIDPCGDADDDGSQAVEIIASDSEDEAVCSEYEEEILIVHENIMSNRIEMQFECDSENVDDIDDVVLPQHITCISHSLSLVATCDANKALEANLRYKNFYQSAFSKAQSLWNAVSRSTKAADFAADICGTRFIVPVLTRWNSTYNAVRKIIKEKSKINEVCEKLSLKKFKTSDLLFLEEYIKVLEPIAVALDNLQGEKNCFLGMVLPSLYSVKLRLNDINHLTHCEPLKTKLLEGLEKRFSSFMNLQNLDAKDFILATVSHPRFKLNWLVSVSDSDRKICNELFMDEFRKVSLKTNGHEHDSEAESDSSDFFSCLSPQSNPQNQVVSEHVADAVLYFEQKKKTLDLLNSYPVVKEIFLRYNTTLPSSASVERMFSSGAQILVPRRCNLSDRMFDNLLFLKGNSFCYSNK